MRARPQITLPAEGIVWEFSNYAELDDGGGEVLTADDVTSYQKFLKADCFLPPPDFVSFHGLIWLVVSDIKIYPIKSVL